MTMKNPAHAYSSPASVEVPMLDVDKAAFERYGTELSSWGRRERRIVANLLHHLDKHGLRCAAVFDGDDFYKCGAVGLTANVKATMEAAFGTDEVSLRIRRKADVMKSVTAKVPEYGVVLIFNNGNDGMDVISDNEYSDSEPVGMLVKEAMDSFDSEVFA
jgi:hypothetical protein